MIKNTGKKFIRLLFIAAILALYALIAVIVVFFVSRNGEYPTGFDTMFYVHRGDFLYHSITEEGNWYPILDMAWYNGVQTWRYWSPVPAYILCGCQALMGGNMFDGYLLFIGLLYFLFAASWLYIGCKHGRPWMGAFIGAIWFLLPNNLLMLFYNGVLARCLSLAALPLLISFIFDWLQKPHWPLLVKIILSFIFILLCHVGWAGMVAIAVLIYLLFYAITHPKKQGRAPILPIIVSIVLSFAIMGIMVLPATQGGVTSLDSSQVMLLFFQPLLLTVSPVQWLNGELVSRWAYFGPSPAPYFGFTVFLLCILGIPFSQKRSRFGFLSATLIVLLTSSTALPLLSMLPGGDMLWMTRFLSIAIAFALLSFLHWITLRRGLQLFLCILLVFEASASCFIFTKTQSGVTPEARLAEVDAVNLIDKTREITTQRTMLPDPNGISIHGGVFSVSCYGDNAVPTSTGQGSQAAVTYGSVVQINQSGEDGGFLYFFDRCLELGNDTVLVKLDSIDFDYFTIEEFDATAARVGYTVAATGPYCRLYKLQNAPDTFGLLSKYRAIGIGTSAPMISIAYPAVEETDSTVLDDYTYEQLSQYDVIYLAGFTYHDRDYAEDMLLRLSENGVRIIIMADGIPADEQTGTQTFLGVSAYGITFSSGYPELDTIDGRLNCDLFPDGYTKWRTVYVNGLDDVWGTLYEEDNRLDFFGTAHNENIIFIGLNLTYHYALTRDAAVGRLLTHALSLSPEELPQRTVVPLSVTYEDNTITVHSDYDDVNTTLAFHDIFDSEQEIYSRNHLTYVKKGDTVIHLHYPYLLEGAAVSLVGLLMTAVFLHNTRRREKKRVAALAEAEAAQAPEAMSGEEPEETPEAQEPIEEAERIDPAPEDAV